MRTSTVWIVLVAGALLAGCSGSANAPAGAGYENISAPELAAMLEAKDFFFVNTHIPYAGDIAGTDASIPYNETQARLAEYPADRSARIVLYCASGRMSAIAAQELAQAGYTEVFNLDGGMDAWQRAGYPLEP